MHAHENQLVPHSWIMLEGEQEEEVVTLSASPSFLQPCGESKHSRGWWKGKAAIYSPSHNPVLYMLMIFILEAEIMGSGEKGSRLRKGLDASWSAQSVASFLTWVVVILKMLQTLVGSLRRQVQKVWGTVWGDRGLQTDAAYKYTHFFLLIVKWGRGRIIDLSTYRTISILFTLSHRKTKH